MAGYPPFPIPLTTNINNNWFECHPMHVVSTWPEPDFESYALISLMGHQEIAGFARVVDIGGFKMLSVEVPEVEFEEIGGKYLEGDNAYEDKKVIFKIPPFTKHISFSAIYSIEPVSEDIAKAQANRLRLTPVGQEAKNDEGYESLPF